MATQEHAVSIQGVALRVSRLDAFGNLLTGPGDSYTTNVFIRVSFTPEYEEGDEITEKAASGVICISYKSPDTLKRVTMEIAVCDPNPEFTALVSGGVLLRKNLGTQVTPNQKSIGWAAPGIGDDPSGNGVAVEAWSRAIREGKPAPVLPFFHFVFPYVKVRASGDRVIENGAMANTFEGFGLGNENFGTGPDERWEFPTITNRPYAWARTDWAPSGLEGYYTWHGVLNAAISNKALVSNVATLTTSAPHEFAPGDQVTVSGVDGVFNGTHAILATPSATTFTFSKTNADVTSAAVNPVGSAVVGAGARAVNDLVDGEDDDAFNVPGNVNYSSERPFDNIVNSVKDQTV